MKTVKTTHFIHAAGLVLALSTLNPQLATCLAQGSLTPPGTPAPTMKSLEQIEPRFAISTPTNITESGSYYLTRNLTNTSGIAVTISTPDVALDLNGFTIYAKQALVISATNGAINVRNGTLETFSGLSTAVSAAATPGLTVESVHFVGWRTGILGGDAFRGERLTFLSHNGNECILVGSNSVVRGVQIVGGRSRTGIKVGDSSTVEDCEISRLDHSFGASFTFGIQVADHCTVRRCTVGQCNPMGNEFRGILLGRFSKVADCVVVGNTSTNLLTGIALGYSCSVERCVASQNTGGDGISVYWACRAADNHCSDNTGAGIYVAATGSQSLIEDNNLANNGFGLLVDSSGNLIVRNTATGNSTNYVIAVNNKVGRIVTVPDSAAISGSSGGAGVGSTDPWANLSF